MKKYCYIRFGKKGVMAAELHHILDYIAYVRDPERLARMIINSLKFHATSEKSLMERILLIREYYHSKDYREQLRKLTDELVNLDYKSYREIIEELIRNKAREWNINKEVLEFVINNLDDILMDIDIYLRKKNKCVARRPNMNTLDKWL